VIVVGQTARVSFREIPNHTFDARVVRTAGALDPVLRTLLTEVQVANADGRLFPGMDAEVRFAPNRAVASTAHALLRPPFTYVKGFVLPKSLQFLSITQ
jgi:multidrug efflux pump subunit AcrA (membrane-fusion protein)